MPGIRAELVFADADTCPVAGFAGEAEGSISDVSWTSANGNGTVTEQFTASTDEETATDDASGGFDPVFDYGVEQVYEFERDSEDPCICEEIEASVGPVTAVNARDGDLHVTVHASDMDDLRNAIGELQEQFGSVRIEYLTQGADDRDESALIPVDVRKLTARQREVLETAYEKGYFNYPRGSNASEVAAELDIEPSTFTEHLNTAQSKLLDELLLRE